METQMIAVLGATVEGRTLAAAALRARYRVVFEDFRADFLREAMAAVRLAAGDSALARFRSARTVEDACREGASLILDCTTDEVELKLEIFTLLDKFAFPGAICATNATSISIAELGAITYRPELCIGLRVRKIDGRAALELVRSPHTLDSAVAACCEFAARLGWGSSVCSEPSGGG